jgi:hypothetical protein
MGDALFVLIGIDYVLIQVTVLFMVWLFLINVVKSV